MAWLGNWSRRIKLTIDHGDIDDALSDFPILVYLSTSSGRNSKDVSCVFDELASDANRKKIAVTTSDGQTQCYVEIEKWDDANEKAWLWVKVPSIASGTDTVLYLYYDKTQPDNDTYVGDPNSTVAETVWGSDCVFVSHMRDDPDNQHVRDSSQYNNDGTKGAADEPIEATAEVFGGVQDFDNIDDSVVIASDPSLDITGAISLGGWAKARSISSPTYPDTIITIEKSTNRSKLNIGFANGQIQVFSVNAAGVSINFQNLGAVVTDTWYQVWVTVNGTTGLVYRNGVQCGTFTLTDGLQAGIKHAWLGKSTYGGHANDIFDGLIALPRAYDTDLSAAWIHASHESETDDLLAFGSEERELPLILKGVGEGILQAKKLGSQHIASGAIISDLIAISAVETQHLAAGAVTSSKIASGAVGIPHIYPGAVISGKLGTNVIATPHIQNQGILSASIGALAVGTPHIANQAVTSAKIGALAVGTPHIAALAIVSGKVASGGLAPLTSGKIWAGFTGNIPREENKPSAGPTIATGSYAGDNTEGRQITVGFKCSLVILWGTAALSAIIIPGMKGVSMDDAQKYTYTELHATDGFTVAYSADHTNDTGVTYYYWAISE